MPDLVIQNMGATRVNVQPEQTVLQALQASHIDWMHACGAKGRCTSCRMIVLEGASNITPLTPAEQRFADAGRLKNNERLTCQCRLFGPVLVRVPEATKLPHQKYDEWMNG